MGILFINWCIICGSILFNNVFVIVYGHGRLVDPPGRNSMWRYGFKTPVDYNDNQLFCGGFNVGNYTNRVTGGGGAEKIIRTRVMFD